jgi:hypothetical protein
MRAILYYIDSTHFNGETNMKNKFFSTLMISLFLMVFLPCASFAQSKDWRAWGYVFGGIGGSSDGGGAFVHVGGGGEGLLYKGFGMGAELGYFAPASDVSGNGLGILSVNPVYHFRNASASNKVVPFVTGGVSLGFRDGASSVGGNFGGGVQYWFKEKVGLRVEYRTHVFSSDRPFLHGIRAGISFR